MKCADCQDPIVESERVVARTCAGCGGGLHSDCAMLGIGENDYCETCFYVTETEYILRMAYGNGEKVRPQ